MSKKKKFFEIEYGEDEKERNHSVHAMLATRFRRLGNKAKAAYHNMMAELNRPDDPNDWASGYVPKDKANPGSNSIEIDGDDDE